MKMKTNTETRTAMSIFFLPLERGLKYIKNKNNSVSLNAMLSTQFHSIDVFYNKISLALQISGSKLVRKIK